MIPESLPVVSETVSLKRYVTVWDRKIRHPDGKLHDWDIIGLEVPPPAFIVVIPFFTKTKTFTFIREWCQGPNKPLYSFSAGQFDRKTTDDIVECAKLELSQETHLKGGTWIRLLPDDNEGICEIKFGTNLFVPFLCIDPHDDPDPHPADVEELIEIHANQPLSKIKELIINGKFLLPSVQSLVMALDYLRGQGHDIPSLI